MPVRSRYVRNGLASTPFATTLPNYLGSTHLLARPKLTGTSQKSKNGPAGWARPFQWSHKLSNEPALLSFIPVRVVTGGVSLLVSFAPNQAAAYNTHRAADNSTLTAANHGSRHGPGTTPDGGTFSLIAPTLPGSLCLDSRAGQNEEHQ